ncbi:HEPN domain-containing protein [Janthinobacterium sp. SUN033]|uniref:HEPN domain-containing protein n=1 Tax=Janthinobacterium sp. SUN033 TaxID=3002439 RepID=UPI0025B2073B|nr:HEPN domain-containing protein [Janthinobacterium sp. SUN033]MDN2675909.1 HEPN domain-containing protein [Janthinobacterium sp. SUN033]
MTTLIHPNAREKIEKILHGILKNYKKQGVMPILRPTELKNLSTEIFKNQEIASIFDYSDLYWLILENLQLSVQYGEPTFLAPPEESRITDEECKEFSKKVLSTIDSLPITYEIHFDVPFIKFGKSQYISEDISYITGIGIENRGNTNSIEFKNYLKIKSSGYATTDKNQSAIHDALSKMKIFMELGRLTGFLKKPMFAIPERKRFGISLPDIDFATVKRTGCEDQTFKARLGLSTSNYLGKITSYNSSAENKTKSAGSQDLSKLVAIYKIIEEKTNLENCKGIRSALEWSFDAEADDDERIKFIKKCIALEASLGEGNENGSITERLSDRCAFTIGKTPTERKEIRDSVRDIYKIRSKFVHGEVSKFDSEQKKLASSCATFLDKVLNAELDSLCQWIETKNK